MDHLDALAKFNSARKSGESVLASHQSVIDEIQELIVELYADDLPTENLDRLLESWVNMDPREFERTRMKYKLTVEGTDGILKGEQWFFENHDRVEIGTVRGGGWLGPEYIVRDCVEL